MAPSDSTTSKPPQDFSVKVFFVIRAVAAVAVAIFLIGYTARVLMLLFGAFLFAIFLSSISHFLVLKFKVSYVAALAITVSLILLILTAAYFYIAPSIAAQIDELIKRLPHAFSSLKTRLNSYSWGQAIAEQIEPANMIGNGRHILTSTREFVTEILAYFAKTIIVVFVGLYGAIGPQRYKTGFLQLVPVAKRPRYSEVIDKVIYTLRWWLVGKFIGMSIIGICTTIGLWALGIPLALTLGLAAALCTFVPNIGPLLSIIPSLLVGLTLGVNETLYIVLLFLGIQAVETYLITPIVLVKTIALPPALTMSTQIILGALLGGSGVALATPLTAAGVVLVRMLYIEDILQAPQPATE